MDLCVCELLRESNKRKFDSCSVRNGVLIISHIALPDCREHIFSDNLSRNSCILQRLFHRLPVFLVQNAYDMLVLYFIEMVTFFKSIFRRRLRGILKLNWNNCNLGQRLPLMLHIYAVTKPLIVTLYWGSNRKSHFPPCTIVYLLWHLILMQKVLSTLIL